jgi:hypothetical protein
VDEPGNWLQSFTLSPDASKAAVIRWAPTYPEVWMWDLGRHIGTRLTHGESFAAHPIWHPDARTLTFVSVQAGNADISSLPADRPGKAIPLVNTPLDEIPNDWSRDGKLLLYDVSDPQNKWDLWYLRRRHTGLQRVPFLQTPFNGTHATFAPTAAVAYTSDNPGGLRSTCRHFRRARVNRCRWATATMGKDGRELFCVQETGLSVPLAVEGFSAGFPCLCSNPKLCATTSRVRAICGPPDGDRILIRELAGQQRPPVIRVRGWIPTVCPTLMARQPYREFVR